MGLFDTEQNRTWYRLWRGGKLTPKVPSQLPEDRNCNACGGSRERSFFTYATERNDSLYHESCHVRGTRAIEGLLRQRDRCGR